MYKRKLKKGRIYEGMVASRYKKGGYYIRRNMYTRKGEVDIFAQRGKEKYVIETKSGQKQSVTPSDIKKLKKKADELGAKPVLYLSRKVQISNEAMKLAKELGVAIKRLRR